MIPEELKELCEKYNLGKDHKIVIISDGESKNTQIFVNGKKVPRCSRLSFTVNAPDYFRFVLYRHAVDENGQLKCDDNGYVVIDKIIWDGKGDIRFDE